MYFSYIKPQYIREMFFNPAIKQNKKSSVQFKIK